MKISFLWAILILYAPVIIAQKSDFLFEQLAIENGLPNNTVNSITRDHLGFIWFGTHDGLARYDGYDFIVYRHDRENSSSVSSNKTYVVFDDNRNRLWVGTAMGLNRYDRETDTFVRYFNDPQDDRSISGNAIKSIYQDKSGNLWIGTLGEGLNRFISDEDGFFRYNLPDGYVTDVKEDSNGNLWVATGAQAIILLDWKNNEFSTFPFVSDLSEDLKPNTLKTLFEDSRGNMWVCTEGAGIYLFDLKQKQFTRHITRQEGRTNLNSNIVNDIFQFDDDHIWIATDGGGVNVYSFSDDNFAHIINNPVDAKSLSSNAVYSFLHDSDDVIWIGTYAGGVNVLNPHRQEFRFYTHRAMDPHSLSHKSVLSFYEDGAGMIWVGTDGGGLNQFNPRKGTFRSFKHDPLHPHSISSNVVTSITGDGQGNLWVGTFAGGLNHFNTQSERFERFTYDAHDSLSIISNNVWTLMKDSEGLFWIGTLDGVNVYDAKENRFFKLQEMYPGGESYPNRILSMFEDSKGRIWLGGNHIWKVNKATSTVLRMEKLCEDGVMISGYDIRDFHEDADGIIWIATEGAGLVRYNEKSNNLVSFTTRDGLPGDAIHQIVKDKTGALWMSTNMGLSRMDPLTFTFSNYNVHDGLQSNQFAYSASLRCSRGELYFGGLNGFNVFHPEKIRNNLTPPNVYITDFSLSNKPVEIGGEDSPLSTHIMSTREIRLPYQSVFSFKFTAINYIATSKNQYRYKLEGFDDWNDVGHQRTATYTNINPGRYVFRVMASNNDGVWNEEGASVEIIILPPFWRTPLAYIVYAIFFFLLFYFVIQYIVNRQKYKHDLMIKDLEKARIEEINQVKLSFFTNIAHEFRTPLTLILGPLDKIMSSQSKVDASTKKQLNIMGRNAGRLLRLVNELMEFRRIEMGRQKLKVANADLVSFVKDVKSVFDEHARLHDIRFSVKSSERSLNAWFDKGKMEKVIYNILSNSFKFTPDFGSIEMKIERVAMPVKGQKRRLMVDHARISVKDSGIGIPDEDQSRIFDRFYQVSNKKYQNCTNGISGTGIGLALAKELIGFHKGDILVESEPGKGSEFSIVFPLDKKYFDQEIVAEQPDNEEYVYQYSPGLYGIPHAELKNYPEPTPSSTDKDKPVLLFVDDNADMRNYMEASLVEDYVVHTAEDGLVGLKKAKELLPDIIVSDVMMPEIDGMEMCRKVKNDIATSHIPVILLTAKASDDFTIEGFDAGADEYIPKPFSPKLLHTRIRNILESRHQLKEKFRKEGILEPSEVSVTSADEMFLKNAMEVVERNISNPEFRVSTFVAEMNMSRSVLYRKFEALTGHSVNEFVRGIRLKRATQLLALNELTVSEITYEVGFNDPQYFSKCFSRQYGMTPSEYAKRQAKKTVSS